MKCFELFFFSKTDAPAVKMFLFCFFPFWSHPLIQLCHVPPLSILPSVTPDNRTTTTTVDHVPPLCTSLLPLTSFVFTNPQWSFLRHISYVSIHLSMELSQYRDKILMSIKSQIIFTKKKTLCIDVIGCYAFPLVYQPDFLHCSFFHCFVFLV